MIGSKSIRKVVAAWVAVNMIWLSGVSGVAHAALITTSEAQQVAQLNYDRKQIIELINQDEVQGKLIAMGVDPEQAKDRVSSLTAEELAQLNEQIEQLPAGGGVLGVILIVFIVFVITDVLGATDIFTFIRPIN